MAGFIPVFLFIAIAVFSKGFNAELNKGKKTARPIQQKPAQFTPPQPLKSANIKRITPEKAAPYPVKHYEGISVKDSAKNFFLEDRNNDWLAKQIKEEQKVLSRKDMLDLGAAHEKACQAEKLRRFHILEHDNSIDTAEGK